MDTDQTNNESYQTAIQRIHDCAASGSTCLYLSGLGLDRLPREIESLTTLKELDCYNNKLTTLAGIENLTTLTKLYCRSNKLTSLAGIENLTALTGLDCGSNQLTSLAGIENLTALKIILCFDNQLSSLVGVESLPGLTRLDCSDNELTNLEGVESLTTLKELDCYNNKLTNLVGIENLTALTRLFCRSNKLTSLAGIEHLTALTELDCGSNQLTSLAGIEALTALTELDCGSNQLTSLAGIEALTALTELDCRHSKLISLAEIENLATLKKLNSRNNKLTTPPQDVADKGLEAIRLWFEQAEIYNTSLSSSTKVILLGEACVGKTTLCRKLKDINIAPPADKDRTVGVDITHLSLEKEDDTTGFQAHLFDFAGQEAQYFAHHFFISEKAFHILMYNSFSTSATLAYWLHILTDINREKPVVLPLYNVFSDRDNRPELPTHAGTNCKPILSVNLLGHNPAVLTGRLVEIKDLITEHITKNQEPVITRWNDIRDYLQNLDIPYISLERYRTICNQVPFSLENETYQTQLLEHLRDTGFVAWFEHSVPDTIFLNPNWIIKAIYSLFKPGTVLIKDGYFSKYALLQHWREEDTLTGRPAYSEAEANLLFSLLLRERFNVCYPCKRDGRYDEERYFVPYFLGTERKDQIWIQAYRTHTKLLLHLHLSMNVIPKGFIGQCVVLFHDYLADSSGEHAHWDRGLVLTYEDVYALLEIGQSLAYGNHLSIKITGSSPRDTLVLKEEITSQLRKLMATGYRAFSSDIYRPCEGCLRGDKPGKKITEYDSIRICDICGYEQSIPSTSPENTTNIYAGTFNMNTNKIENKIEGSPGAAIAGRDNRGSITTNVSIGQSELEIKQQIEDTKALLNLLQSSDLKDNDKAKYSRYAQNIEEELAEQTPDTDHIEKQLTRFSGLLDKLEKGQELYTRASNWMAGFGILV